MTTYEIAADGARTYGLRNKDTKQIEHSQFLTIAEVRSFFKVNFAWDPTYRLVG